MQEEADQRGTSRSDWRLTLGAVGVVYGDIGTSPLYAFRETVAVAADQGLTGSEVLGGASLLLWALILIVSIKYVIFLLTLDNRGEGGILSLFALIQSRTRTMGDRSRAALLAVALCGAAFFFGDAAITPAISVLSAVEGLTLINPALSELVVPLSIAILVGLFAVQRRGVGPISKWFGPIVALWFITIAAFGALMVVRTPEVLVAIDPSYGVRFLIESGPRGLLLLGAVFLAVTGAEALYADLGHFGKRPIRRAWFVLVFPALALSYLGQAALVLSTPEASANPFFLLAPTWALGFLVLIASATSVIASQAVITGAFSLARQAVQLGLLPRLEVRHTSEEAEGRIYVPLVNWPLFAAVVLLILIFETSSGLAAAYGLSVAGAMLATSVLAAFSVRLPIGLTAGAAVLIIAPALLIEAAFMTAASAKLLDGAIAPLLAAAVLMAAMWTWRRGTGFLNEKARRETLCVEDARSVLNRSSAVRVAGTAFFLTSDPATAPMALFHNLKHNHVLHEHIVILAVETADAPRVRADEAVVFTPLDERFAVLRIKVGYMETPNIPQALAAARRQGLRYEIMASSFFLTRRRLVSDPKRGLPAWQDRLFIMLAQAASDPTDYFRLPRDRVIEIGSRVAL